MTDTDILYFATQFRAAIIGDNRSDRLCAALSDPLCAALAVKGVQARVMESDLGHGNHVFLLLADGRVLDPTADQFNAGSTHPLPRVFLGPAAAIHANAVPRPQAAIWQPLLNEFKRLAPQYSPQEVGSMVRLVLATLPEGMCELPSDPECE